MSASPAARQAVSQGIPMSRRININHESELPNDLSSTPGGSLFSTTPGGTRVYYDRNFMLSMRNSPLARTPPTNLPSIPGVTVPDNRPAKPDSRKSRDSDEDAKRLSAIDATAAAPAKDEDEQFQIEL
ncbi:eukaryotic translation initiation factor 4E-binding protein 1-like [Hyalella azteca]|uniref:Eukaryotic translation initiation factor 4E-binding protein 1-like n=1 Tax=Hyalella azteca TaxID=294128 RepID=A0A8B7PMF3_HYAAZ|nr:eukaryotic translation initiation factor 4E-binding protein 1-like [Hyalella azteca]